MVNVGKDSVHRASGIAWIPCFPTWGSVNPARRLVSFRWLNLWLAFKHLVIVKESLPKTGVGGGCDIAEWCFGTQFNSFPCLGECFSFFFSVGLLWCAPTFMWNPNCWSPTPDFIIYFFRCYDFGFLTFIPGMNKWHTHKPSSHHSSWMLLNAGFFFWSLSNMGCDAFILLLLVDSITSLGYLACCQIT